MTAGHFARLFYMLHGRPDRLVRPLVRVVRGAHNAGTWPDPKAATGELKAGESPRPAPSGSPTRGFLFADLRDYTRYVEGHGAVDAAELLVRYRAIVRQAVAEHDGAEIKTEGDSFYVVFPAVSAAVLCGLAIVAAAGVDRSRRHDPAGDPGRGRDPRRRDDRDPRRLRRLGRSTSPPGSAPSPGPARSSSATRSGR